MACSDTASRRAIAGSRTAVPRSQRICSVCHVGQPGDEFHLVLECQGLQHIRDPGLFGQNAGTIVQCMWQAELHGVSKFVTDCMGVYYSTDPEGRQAYTLSEHASMKRATPMMSSYHMKRIMA